MSSSGRSTGKSIDSLTSVPNSRSKTPEILRFPCFYSLVRNRPQLEWRLWRLRVTPRRFQSAMAVKIEAVKIEIVQAVDSV